MLPVAYMTTLSDFLPNLVLFALIAISLPFLITFLVLKRKHPKEAAVAKRIGIVVILFLSLLALCLFYSADSFSLHSNLVRFKRTLIPEISTDIKQVADAYLKEKVGENNFSKWYEYNSGGSYQFDGYRYNIEYTVLPLKRIGVTHSLNLTVLNNKVEEDYEQYSQLREIPLCQLSNKQCDFNITRESLRSLVGPGEIKDVQLIPPNISVTVCPGEKRTLIEYSTGVVLMTSESYSGQTYSGQIRLPVCGLTPYY